MHVFASFRQYLTETIFTMAYFKLALDSISYRQDFYNGIFLLVADNISQQDFYKACFASFRKYLPDWILQWHFRQNFPDRTFPVLVALFVCPRQISETIPLEVACFCKSQRQISLTGLLKWHAFVSLRPISQAGLLKWHAFVSLRQISLTIPLEVACFCKSQTDLIDMTLEVACFCKSQTDLAGRTLEVACFCKSQTDLRDRTLEIAYFCKPQTDLRVGSVTTECIF
jgi:hypothetical protein